MIITAVKNSSSSLELKGITFKKNVNRLGGGNLKFIPFARKVLELVILSDAVAAIHKLLKEGGGLYI